MKELKDINELNFLRKDLNYLKYEYAKSIVGRQGTEDSERPDDTIIVFEAIAKSTPTENDDGTLSGEAWCRAYILCDCGGTHLIESDKTIGEQMKNVFDEHPEYICKEIDSDDNVLIANILYKVDPEDSEHGMSIFSFRRSDGIVECSILYSMKGKTKKQINDFMQKLQKLQNRGDITITESEE